MTTNTPDTTRLTDEQVQESLSWLSRAQQAESHTVAVALWANTYGHQLHAHITTLAAELARVEGENARLRDVIEWATTETFVVRPGMPEDCFPRTAWNRVYERLRAALKGADNAE